MLPRVGADRPDSTGTCAILASIEKQVFARPNAEPPRRFHVPLAASGQARTV
jgi:hypothetical protein